MRVRSIRALLYNKIKCTVTTKMQEYQFYLWFKSMCRWSLLFSRLVVHGLGQDMEFVLFHKHILYHIE